MSPDSGSDPGIVVFIGPTLRGSEVAAVCEAVCLPPAAQGDVYRAALQRPRAIGIVDGYFSGAPSVWHKEILWALSQGIHVFGSASMGALRAAELHGFGMRGVGRIFEAFRDGLLEDDDEVALVHGPAETGFVAASEPMVNIRATLARAQGQGVVGDSSRHGFEDTAKALFFPHRIWPTILDNAGARGVTPGESARLRDWLPRGRVDQKREDALEMLAEMKETAERSEAFRAGFVFEWTSHWDAFVARTTLDSSLIEPTLGPRQRGIVEELRLEGAESYGRVRDRALLRLLGDREASRRGLAASPDEARARLGSLRASLGLFSRAQLDVWLKRNHLGPDDLEGMLNEDVRARGAIGPMGSPPDRHLLDELRLSGAYERLNERAGQKRRRLAARAQGGLKGMLSPPDTLSLRRWFFEHRLRTPAPDDIILAATEGFGFSDVDQFDRAIRDEWLYIHATED